MVINWSKLQPYKTTKQKSFEQLCYQIAAKLFVGKGIFTPIDDSGGGDGVEFYLTFENGEQWGWQAKYYEGSVRLNEHNRKQKIIGSLKRAIEVHPNLCVWYLCLPMDLTPDETTWLSNELPKHIPPNRTIKIGEEFLWNESFIHEKLNQPEFNGLKQAFFNQLELSANWFQNAFANSSSIVSSKFDKFLYVPNEEFEYWYVNPVLCNEKFRDERISYYPEKLKELYKEALEKINTLNYTSNDWQLLFEEYKKNYTTFNEAFHQLLPKIKWRYQNITPNEIENLSENDFSVEVEQFSKIKENLEQFRIAWQEEYRNNLPKEESEKEKNESLSHFKCLWKVEDIYKKIVEELRYFVRDSCIPVKFRVGHFLGNGGDGKTNFAIALAKQYLDKGFPSIFLPAIKFTASNPLPEQILSHLDIKSIYSFGDFLDCLNELGKIYNQRVPIILDGLNEAINNNGFLNERLALDMPSLENEILQRKNLSLITTCRKSYKKGIWGKVEYEGDHRFYTFSGFSNDEDRKRLVRKYFEHYKIQADLSFLSLQRFKKPLYLKIFCESVNPTREKVKQVTLGYDSIYSIFEKFVDECNANIFKRLERTGIYAPTLSNKNIASRVLKQIAEQLWLHSSRAFPLEELMKITDGNFNPIYNNSIAKALLDEELLLIRNWFNGEENVYLTYDLMAGYFIANYLLDSIPDFKEFFEGNAIVTLVNDDYEKLHPNHEDILDSLCSLLPIKKGIFVHDLIDKRQYKDHFIVETLLEKSIKSTVQLSPEYIPQKQIEFLEKLCTDSKNIIALLSLCEGVLFVSNHPFNFSFWSKKLKILPMNERDFSWTEYLRALDEIFIDDLITEFKLLQTYPSLIEEQIQKIYLVADFLMWTFTSTSKSLKVKSSDALYLFAVKFPKIFLQQYYKSVEINDPTIFEWMSLVLYNVLITVTKTSIQKYKEDLVQIANFLKDEVLTVQGHYPTNNLITRNYAYNSLRLLVQKDLINISLEKVKNDFKTFGIVNWEENEDLNAGEYREGNSLIDYHFNKEKMPYVMVGRGNEYDETPEFKSTKAKLRWRAYQLGYSFKLFGEIDKKIANHRHYEEESKRTDRYADKYIEIAFLEYCGYLEGLKKFDSFNDVGYLRTFELKHDPTKTEDDKTRNLVNERFIKTNYIDTKASLKEWCNDDTIPDIKPYLIINQFKEKKGNFVLLDSIVHQHNKELERQIFFKIDVVFIKNKSLKAARKAFTEEVKLGWAAHSIPNISQIHESEIPDAPIIPYNEFVTWHYSNSSKLVDREYITIELVKKGKFINEIEANELWSSILQSHHFMTISRTNFYNVPFIQYRYSADDPYESLEDIFKKNGIKLFERKSTKKKEQKIDKSIGVFPPVCKLKDKVYLCKNIIDYFNLSSRIGETDLLDEKGELASFNFTYEIEYVDQEALTYVRRDLLDKYLKDNELTMFTIVWGERDYYPPDGDWMKNTPKIREREWSKFYKAIEYNVQE